MREVLGAVGEEAVHLVSGREGVSDEEMLAQMLVVSMGVVEALEVREHACGHIPPSRTKRMIWKGSRRMSSTGFQTTRQG